MQKVKIRVAKKRDIRAISKFGTPVVKEMKFYNREHMARNIYELSIRDLNDTLRHNRNGIVIALSDSNSVIGMCVHYVSHGHVDWLDWLLVDKRYRKMGIGKALMEFAIKDAKKKGCHKMWCNSNPENKPMLKFMPKLGFRKIGIAKRHAFKEDEILWERIFG